MDAPDAIAPVRGLTFVHDGRFAIFGKCDKAVHVQDVARGRRIRAITGHAEPVDTVVHSAVANLVLAKFGERLHLWEPDWSSTHAPPTKPHHLAPRPSRVESTPFDRNAHARILACLALTVVVLAACTPPPPADEPTGSTLPTLDDASVYAWSETDSKPTPSPGATAVGDAVYAWATAWPSGAAYSPVNRSDGSDPGIVSADVEPLTPENYRGVERVERGLDHWLDGTPVGRVEPTGYVQPTYDGGEVVIDTDGDGHGYGVSVTVVPAHGYVEGHGAYRSDRNHETFAPRLIAGCDDHPVGEGDTARVISFVCDSFTTSGGADVLVSTETVTRAELEDRGSARTTVVLYRSDGTAVIVRGRFGVLPDLSVEPPATATPDVTVEDLVALAEALPTVAVV